MDEEPQTITRSLVWWKPPEEVDPVHLVQSIMDLGTPEMVAVARARLDEAVMREALVTAGPGSFSERSWNYWHVVFGLRPTPPLPRRNVPDSRHVPTEIRHTAAGPARLLAAAR